MDNKIRLLDKIKKVDPLNSLIILSLFMAFYTGFRMPGLWSVNYYIPSMFEGFYRRSLVGTILYVFGDLRFNYMFIAAIQVTLFSVLLGVLLRYAFRAEDKLKAVFVLYLLAPTGGYLFHEIGYIEQLLYLILFVALYLSNPMLGLGLMVASLFVHEMALFTTIPIYFAYLILKTAPPQQSLIHAAVISVSFGILFVCFQTAPEELIKQFSAKTYAAFGPGGRADYYNIFYNTFNHLLFDNTFSLPSGASALPPHGNYFVHHLGFELASACLFGLSIATLFVHKKNSVLKNIWRLVVVWCACIAPLFLAFLGMDTMRWIFLSFSSALVLLCFYRSELPRMRFAASLFILALFLAYGHLWYFDGLRPRTMDIQSSFISFWTHDALNVIINHPGRWRG